jgi:uncharacterized membrane protein YgdD (TMEM256/DUF423 family)
MKIVWRTHPSPHYFLQKPALEESVSGKNRFRHTIPDPEEPSVMERTWFATGAVLAAIAVAAGAFGAHGLENRLSADDLDTYQTAARYHIYHALGLLAVAYASKRFEGGLVTASGWLFIAGIVLFSGSLYVLSLSGVKILGAVAPIGGVCFLAGWGCLAIAAWRS